MKTKWIVFNVKKEMFFKFNATRCGEWGIRTTDEEYEYVLLGPPAPLTHERAVKAARTMNKLERAKRAVIKHL